MSISIYPDEPERAYRNAAPTVPLPAGRLAAELPSAQPPPPEPAPVAGGPGDPVRPRGPAAETQKPRGGQPTVHNGADEFAGRFSRGRRRGSAAGEVVWRRFAMYPVLVVMAGADAYGFWNTLTKIIKRDTSLVLVFVIALAFGAVAVAHEIGRLLRSRMEGYGGSVAWMGLLSVLWLALGGAICWLRAHDAGQPLGQASGELAVSEPTSTVNSGSVELALLLLGLYLLTGALAMSHAYRFGDPRSAQVRRAHRRREKLALKLAERQYELRLAQGHYAARRDDRVREREQRDHEQELNEAWKDQLRTEAQHEAAYHQRDPAATDALVNHPRHHGGTE